jgi:hypothetical protein
MATLSPDDPLARAAVEAIHGGDARSYGACWPGNPGLATARIAGDDDREGGAITRTLLHVATDWPRHFRNGVATVAALIDAGAEVDARNTPNTETPLHWAASSGDVAVPQTVIASILREFPDDFVTHLEGAVPLPRMYRLPKIVDMAHRTVTYDARTALRYPDRTQMDERRVG